MAVIRCDRFRALITLYSLEPRPEALHAAVSQFHNHTHALMVRARPLRQAGSTRYIPPEISWDGEQPLRRGDSCVVTVTVTDDEAGEYLGAGRRFTLWSGGEVAPAISAIRPGRYLSLFYWSVGNDQITRGVSPVDFIILIAVGLCALAASVAALRNADLN
jgi:hypothetical protein